MTDFTWHVVVTDPDGSVLHRSPSTTEDGARMTFDLVRRALDDGREVITLVHGETVVEDSK